MKSPEEIKKAHDMIAAFYLGHIPTVMDARDRHALMSCLDVLCWVLGHDHNTAFANNLERLQAITEAHGLALVKRDQVLH